jgi:hypothetical protein
VVAAAVAAVAVVVFSPIRDLWHLVQLLALQLERAVL